MFSRIIYLGPTYMKLLGIVFVGSKWTIQNTYLIDNLVRNILVFSAKIDLRV